MHLRSVCEAAESIAGNSVRIVELSGNLLTAVLPLILSPAKIESPEPI